MSPSLLLAERPAAIIEEITRRPTVEDVPSEVIILGAGISGMLAAWACDQRGRSFVIVDKGPAVVLPRLVQGCVYLHEPCDLEVRTSMRAYIREQELSTSVCSTPWAADASRSYLYHRKVWNDTIPYEQNSLDKYMGISTIYSMNDALRLLHSRYQDYLVIREVLWSDILKWLQQGRKVISTIPQGVFFPDYPLISRSLWTWQAEIDNAAGLAAYTIYNVDSSVAWYRMSSMFGNMAIEFIRPPVGDLKVAKFTKIISRDMSELDALHKNLLFTGRWGRWQRGFLSHQTYREVLRKFDSGEWR